MQCVIGLYPEVHCVIEFAGMTGAYDYKCPQLDSDKQQEVSDHRIERVDLLC